MTAELESNAIADVIRVAAASTEERFLDIAERLESSSATITTLTNTFGALSTELQSENVQQATRDLGQIAQRVSVMAQAQTTETEAFLELARLTAAIGNRVKRMGGSVREVGILAMNAKIAGACIDDAGVDLVGFASEINRTLRVAQSTLESFESELSSVGQLLRTGIATRSALEKRQTAAVHAIPLRLGRSVEALATRSVRAAATAISVEQRSQSVGGRIGDAVMALQIGDSTRQRIEHVDYALGLLAEIEAEHDDANQPEGSGWGAVPYAQRAAVSGFCRRLQSAQLIDTAEQFDHEVQQLLKSLQELADDACGILQLGDNAFGASKGRQGTFLGEVKDEVGEVNSLLTGFLSMQREAGEVVASVSDATVRLVSHINNVRSLETDIRIMGLNMTFKCGRIGAAGRPLSVIAQELRTYARKIAAEASDVIVDLDRVVALAGDLSARTRDDGAAEAAAAGTMTNSLARLAVAGQSLADAWEALEQDGHVVADLLRETVARTHVHEEIGRVLRTAASGLLDVGPRDKADIETACPQVERLLELIMASYTMEAERAVFLRHVPGWRQHGALETAMPSGSAAAVAGVDDMFF